MATKLAAQLRAEVSDLKLLTYRQAAELLGVSEGSVRRLIKEYVELGERGARVSIKTIRQLISDRTIKNK